MAHINNKYKLGDLVIYNHKPYKVTAIRRITTSIPYAIWAYEYDLKLVREPREGELSVIRGVNERAISRKGDDERKECPDYYFPGYKFDPKFIENMMYPVKSSLTALEELNKREVERIMAEPIRIDIDDAIKANYSKEEIKKMINKEFGVPKFEYKKIIFNGPCTIILWKDGTKTIAKASDGEMFDPEKGVAICFMKRALGETEGKKVLRKANKGFYDEVAREANKELEKLVKPVSEYCGEKVVMEAWDFGEDAARRVMKPMDNNKIIQVEKVEENHKMDFRSCLDCKYASKPVTDKPCSDCASKSRFERGYEK